MAKSKPLTLSDLNLSLKSSDLKMNPSIASQLQGAMGAPASKADDNIVATESNLSKNLNQMAAAIRDNTSSTRQNTEALNKKGKGGTVQSQDLTENQIEDKKTKDYQTSLLEAIAENTGVKAKKEDKTDKLDSPWAKLGAWGLALAAAVGAFVGIVQAQIKAMMMTLQFIGKAAKWMYNLLPESLRSSISKSLKVIPNFFKDLATKLEINLTYAKNLVVDFFKNKFAKVFVAIENGLVSIKEFFSRMFKIGGDGVGKIAELFGKVAQGIKNFFAPIGEAWTTIKNFATPVQSALSKVTGFFKGIAEFFSGAVAKFSVFGKVLGAFKTIIGKIALPITIIMGLFDGITEAIEGFKKDGIMGGIEGFITGALKSLVGSLLDLVKNALSWILGAIGFDKAEKFLDSFSFSDMIKDFVSAIFHPIDTVKTAFESIMKMLSKIEIPGIDFSLFGKNFKFGPWKPFDNMGQTQSNTKEDVPALNKPIENKQTFANIGDSSKNKLGEKVVPPMGEANNVYNKSAKVDAAKAESPSKEKSSTIVTTQQVNNQTQQAIIKSPIRNNEHTLNSYYKQRYV